MRTKVTLVLIFLNVGLFFFIFKFERHWRTEAASLEARRRVLGAETSDIHALVVTSAAPNGSFSLERKERDNWSLTAPLDWPANPNAVSRIVNELRLLEHETSFQTAGLAKMGRSLADYGLEKPKLTIAFTSGDPAPGGGPLPPTILRVGDKSPDGSRIYLLSPDGETIHVVSRTLVDHISVPLDQLRADTLLTIPVFEARSLRVESTSTDAARAGSVRVRVRHEGPRWTFDTPITARASKPAIEVAINELNQLKPKTFNPPAPATLPSSAPTLRVTLEGNNRYETLFLGEPVTSPKPEATETEYYAQLENRSVLFTAVVANKLVDKLRNAPEKLRETQILDFDRQAVTSITLAAPVLATSTPVVLQRLETAANPAEGAAWQIVRRGEGSAGVQTTPADRAAVQRLLDQLGQLSAKPDRGFVSDNPSSADLENWGFNRPEREITLTLAPAAASGAATTANATLTLQLGKDASQKIFARTPPNLSVYAVDIDLANELPIEPIAWRERTVALVPPNARITALRLTELPSRRVAFETSFDAAGQPAAGIRNADAAKQLAKQLGALHAKRFRPEPFGGEERIWRYQLEVTFALPAGATAAEQTETKTLMLSERLGGAEQLAGSRELDLLFDVDQAFIDALFPLAEGAHDPGPPAEPKK